MQAAPNKLRALLERLSAECHAAHVPWYHSLKQLGVNVSIDKVCTNGQTDATHAHCKQMLPDCGCVNGMEEHNCRWWEVCVLCREGVFKERGQVKVGRTSEGGSDAWRDA
jgi:hypothetical protein